MTAFISRGHPTEMRTVPGLETWAAGSTIVAAGIAIVTLGGTFLFRVGMLWERVHRLVDLSEQNRDKIADLQVDVRQLWVAFAENIEPPEDLLSDDTGKDQPIGKELIDIEEEQEDDEDRPRGASRE